ncbi:YcjX family protein [Acetobacteraceae bacterium KSS8]|uniref:YcjX family protein n=1 Tax=Endosaccharibacter trunci TaxID=2812733 RepID=A0ABT1W3R3_9PROT|nr:YcjX family protein [Acetobacteraceae bacterium KSS8]
MKLRNPLDHLRPRTVRIGVTGLARSGKTVLLTALAATLLARDALGGRIASARIAPAGADSLPRFDVSRHLAALAADPPRWPDRTNAVSLLALDLTIAGGVLPDRQIRLELLDYPGEWLMDLPLLDLSFADWSRQAMTRLEAPAIRAAAEPFLRFASALPAGSDADEALVAAGHRLYVSTLHALRDRFGLSLLQPGRFLMPAPGEAPPWSLFFPLASSSPLARLMERRYSQYVEATRESLLSPAFGRIDRLVVLADILGALHAGPDAFADAQAALAAASGALRWQGSWLQAVAALARLQLPPRVITRVCYAASKADHVSERQRGNLAALMGALTDTEQRRGVRSGNGSSSLAIAALRCTEDFVWTLDGHPVSAVRGRRLGEDRMTRSYPGEVPDKPPGPEFWQHPFLELPVFEPPVLTDGGRDGVPNIGLDALLDTLLGDLL